MFSPWSWEVDLLLFSGVLESRSTGFLGGLGVQIDFSPQENKYKGFLEALESKSTCFPVVRQQIYLFFPLNQPEDTRLSRGMETDLARSRFSRFSLWCRPMVAVPIGVSTSSRP